MAPVVFLVAVWVRDQPEPAGMWVAGLAVALVAIARPRLGSSPGSGEE